MDKDQIASEIRVYDFYDTDLSSTSDDTEKPRQKKQSHKTKEASEAADLANDDFFYEKLKNSVPKLRIDLTDDVEIFTEEPPEEAELSRENANKHVKNDVELVQQLESGHSSGDTKKNEKSHKYPEKNNRISKLAHRDDDDSNGSNDDSNGSAIREDRQPEIIEFTREFDLKEDLFEEVGKILKIKKGHKNSDNNEDEFWKIEYEHPRFSIGK